MEITRRSFIQTFGSAAAMVAAGGLNAALGQKKASDGLYQIPVEVYSEPLFSMTSKQLEPFIGNMFTATSADGRTVHLVLTELNQLEALQNTVRGYYGECFSLIFEGPDRHRLLQGIYEMRADGLPTFTALVVPTGRRQRQYEVIINHLGR